MRNVQRVTQNAIKIVLQATRYVLHNYVYPEGLEPTTFWSDPASLCASVRTRTQNSWSEAKRDIHFTTEAHKGAGLSS